MVLRFHKSFSFWATLGTVALFALLAGGTMAATGVFTSRRIAFDDQVGGGGLTVVKNRPIITPLPVVCTTFDCTINQKVKNVEAFMYNHKQGLTYTPDPRNLTPVSEMVRLTIVTQALGYLNLYQKTNTGRYLQEAQGRLDAVLSYGPAAQKNGNFDGELGYAMLLGYSASGNTVYRDYGMTIANKCLWWDDAQMNWGYMCGMALGKAYQLTGDVKYLNRARAITQRTGSKQFPDGAWPHQANLADGKNISYSAWLMFEMIEYRKYDPENPDVDFAILKTGDFLANRVNSDGSLSYEDTNGSYAEDPTGADSRSWTHDLAAIAYNLKAVGKNDAAQRALSFLFTKELTGDNLGGYPDKWDNIDPDNLWMTGSPSIVRTSLVFWYLTRILLLGQGGSCPAGQITNCTVSPTNCSASFKELNLCNSGITGTNVCVDGIATGCLDTSRVHYESRTDCLATQNCCYDSFMKQSQIMNCASPGERKCIDENCSDYCIDAYTDMQQCQETWTAGDICGGLEGGGGENQMCL